MLIDFQQHYTPPDLLKGDPGKVTVDLDGDGNPNYLLNPLLADLPAHIRMMDAAGIDAGVLSCGSGLRPARPRALPARSTTACAKPSKPIPAASSGWRMCRRSTPPTPRPN